MKLGAVGRPEAIERAGAGGAYPQWPVDREGGGMRPVMQTTTIVPGGDCLRACLASILEESIENVPHVCDGTGDDFKWFVRLSSWLKTRGLYPVEFTLGERSINCPIEGYCILGVVTDPPTSVEHPEWIHAVVGRSTVTDEQVRFEVVHDPNPKPRKVVEVRDAIWIVKNIAEAA